MFWTLLLSSALAGQLRIEVGPEVARSADQQNALLEASSGQVQPGDKGITLLAQDASGRWVSAEQLQAEAPPVPEKDAPVLGGPPIDHPGSTDGALSGKAIYASQCHGWIWNEVLVRFATQRGNHHDTVEDLHNPEGMNQYLIHYLENAGARVYTTKERDHNPEMALSDNDGEGYSETGDGFETGPAGFVDAGSWAYGENPFSGGTTRRFAADSGSVASWIPEVPADGLYAVYVSWDSDPENSSSAHYRIEHPGGTIHRRMDQRVHGSTWQYLETLWLPEGVEGLTVSLIADGEPGTWLSADAVRVGGGMGDVSRHGTTTGRPRHEEGAILYNQFNGAPTSVYDPSGDGDGSDPSTRSRWAAWEHPIGEDAVYLSWHSNAFNGEARGTTTYYYDGDYAPVDGSGDLARSIQDELMGSIQTHWDASWNDRGLNTAAFSELSTYHNNEMPAVLVELAFHDNETDAWHLKEPRFRRDMSRAMYRGIVGYFAARDGTTPQYLPEPPTQLQVRHGASGKLVAEWEPGASGGILGDPADGYRVYQSTDGRSWDRGTAVDGLRLKLNTEPGEQVFVRVAASNEGGMSFPTETLGARRSPDGWTPVLVVSAFDRLQGSNLVWEDVPTLDWVVRMPLERVNGFDTTAAAGRAIGAAGWYFDSISDERLSGLDLSDYGLIIWSAGQESTEDETFSAEQQAIVRDFVAGGGALFVSGSEVLWDLDARGDSSDQAFAAEVLSAGMASDDAGTTIATGSELLSGIILDFGEADGAPYPVNYPDVLDSSATVIATYEDGSAAAILHDSGALFGFPFECIGSSQAQEEVMALLLPELLPDYDPPELGDTGAAAHDTGRAAHDSGSELPPLQDEEDKGCSCSTSSGGAAVASLWVLALGSARRRSGRSGA